MKQVMREYPEIDAPGAWCIERCGGDRARVGSMSHPEARRTSKRTRRASVDEVRAAPLLITFSAASEHQHQELKQFLRLNLYSTPGRRMTNKARRIVADLFHAFITDRACSAAIS